MEWFTKAARDWQAAETVLRAEPPLADVAAFHCQQAVEKTLKGFLTCHARVFEKTHDLRRLCRLCADVEPSFAQQFERVTPLNEYAVGFRYPGSREPDVDEVRGALASVDALWAFVLERLPEDLKQACFALRPNHWS